MAYDYESAIRSAISDTAVGSMAKSRTKSTKKKKSVTPSKKPKKLVMPKMVVPTAKPKNLSKSIADIDVSLPMDGSKVREEKKQTKKQSTKRKGRLESSLMQIKSFASDTLGNFSPYYSGGEIGIKYRKDI
jgi:hypothetical protein